VKGEEGSGSLSRGRGFSGLKILALGSGLGLSQGEDGFPARGQPIEPVEDIEGHVQGLQEPQPALGEGMGELGQRISSCAQCKEGGQPAHRRDVGEAIARQIEQANVAIAREHSENMTSQRFGRST